jgi:membrane protein YdbS with pleckstrin-like domain
MQDREFVPNSKYQIKMMLMITLLAFLILLGMGILAALISLDDPGAGLVIMGVTIACDALYWLVGMILAVPYFRSLRYEVLEDEVIVHVGILTHSVKHVPYRTVTNITVKRDIFDRWFFNLGSLNIQTAGMSGQSGAEEKLVGLENVQEVYEMVVAELRRFRGVMPPTTVQEELSPDASRALLAEVQAIRQLLEKQSN